MIRHVLLIAVLLAVAVVAIAGRRGSLSRKPPIELFPDMDRQPKLRPQASSSFFPDGLSSRLPVSGTVARSRPIEIGGVQVHPHEEHPLNTGRVKGVTNWVQDLPLPVTAQLLARGQQQFGIHCAPCHGATAEGKGITTRLGMVGVADLHQLRLVQMADGEIFNTITHGKNLMGAYGANIDIPDRWAVVAYLRALQRSRLAAIDDVPAGERARLPNAPPPAAAKP